MVKFLSKFIGKGTFSVERDQMLWQNGRLSAHFWPKIESSSRDNPKSLTGPEGDEGDIGDSLFPACHFNTLRKNWVVKWTYPITNKGTPTDRRVEGMGDDASEESCSGGGNRCLMKAEFYQGASRTRVHIMDDFGNTTMMSAHVFTDEAQAQAFFELWQLATSAAQRDLLWVIGKCERRKEDPRRG